MTTTVHVVSPEDTLTSAREAMHAHRVRHLPVLEDQRLVGVVTLSDLYAAEAILQADPDATPVEQLMARELYAVPPETPLAVVAATMVERHVESALVVRGETLLGLFTATDACRALALVLQAAES